MSDPSPSSERHHHRRDAVPSVPTVVVTVSDTRTPETDTGGQRVAELLIGAGHLEVGELAVVIAAAAPHRAEAFEACRFAIDTLKQTVPIWKKEVATDGQYWVDDHA